MSSNGVDYFNRLAYMPRDPSFVPSEDDEDTEIRADEHFPYSDSDIYDRNSNFAMFSKDEDEEDEDEDDDDDDDEDSDRDHSEVEYGDGPLSLTGAAVISFHQGEATDFTAANTRGYADNRDRSLYTHSETDVTPNNITPRRINARMGERTPTPSPSPCRDDSEDENFGSHRRHDIYASMLSEHANLVTASPLSDNGPSRMPPKRRRDQAEEEASSNGDSQNSSSSTASYEASPSMFHHAEHLQISRSPLHMTLSEHDDLNNSDSGGSGPRIYRHFMENTISPSIMDQPPRKRGRSNEGQVIDRTSCQTRSGIYIGTDSPSASPTVNSNSVVDLTTPASVITLSSTLSPFSENLSPYSSRGVRIEPRFHSSSSPLTTRSRYVNIVNDIETRFSDDLIAEADHVGSSDEERFRRQEEEMDRLSLNNHRPIPPRNSSDSGSVRPPSSSISVTTGPSSHPPSSSSSYPMRRISSSSLAELPREIRRENEDIFSSSYLPLHPDLPRSSPRREEYLDGPSIPYRSRPSNEIERSNFMSMIARMRRTRGATGGTTDNQSNENFVRYDILSDTLDRVYGDRNRNNSNSNRYNNHNNHNNYNHHNNYNNSIDRHDNPTLGQPGGRNERSRPPLEVDDEHQPRSSIPPSYRSSHRPRSPPGLFSNRMQVRSRPRVSSPPSYWNPLEDRASASRDRERLRRFGDLDLRSPPIQDEYRVGNQRDDGSNSLPAVNRNGNSTSTEGHDEREISDEEVARRLQEEEYRDRDLRNSHFRRNMPVMENPMYTPVLTDFLPDLDETSGIESPPPPSDTSSGGPATRTRSSGVPLSLPPIDNPSRRQLPLLPPVPSRRLRRLGDSEANRSNRINNFMDVLEDEDWRSRPIASGSGSSSRTRNAAVFANSSSSSSSASNITAPPSAPTFSSRARATRFTTSGEISSSAARSRSGHGPRPLMRFQPPNIPTFAYYGNGFASLYNDLSFLPVYNSYGLASNPDNYMDDDEFDSSYEGLLRLSEQIGDAKPKGVPEGIVKTLPTKTWAEFKASKEMMNGNRKMKKKAEEGDEDLNRCTICLTEYEDQDILRFLLCQHEYHQNCVAIWLQDNDNCPICRQKIIPEKD